MSYTPPNHNNLGFAFTGTSYTPPAHNQLRFAFGAPPGTLIPGGWDSSVIGTPTVYNLKQIALAAGWDSSLFGTAVVTQPRKLSPSGWDTSVFGTATAYLKTRYLTPSGWESDVMGSGADIFLKTRYIAPGLGIADGAYGTPFVSYVNRTLAPAGLSPSVFGTANIQDVNRTINMTSQGFASEAYGTAFVSLGLRQIYPQWWVDTFYGSVEVGYDRTITGAGFVDELFGTATVHDNRQYPGELGWDSSVFGAFADIDFAVRRVGAYPVEPGDYDRWTPPRIYNLTQYIIEAYKPADWIEGDVGGNEVLTMFVVNKNRVIDVVGNGIKPPLNQIGINAQVNNNARLLAPIGLSETYGGTLVAPRIRSVFPAGWDDSTWGLFTNAYNAARVLSPAGFLDEVFGLSSVVNTRRYYDHVGLADQSALGTPFVDFRIRTLDPSVEWLSPVGGLIGTPTVWFQSRPITPLPWVDPNPFGNVSVDRGWDDQFHAQSILSTLVVSQDLTVANKTPQLYPYWDSSLFTQFGAILVHHNPEYLSPEGDDMHLFGAFGVDYRTKTIFPPGLAAARMNLLHHVRNVNPDPPAVQYIITPELGETDAIPYPVVTANSLYPTAIDDWAFGTALVKGNGIFPIGIPYYFDADAGGQMGIPSLPNTFIIGLDGEGMLTETWANPDFMPRTIWAPSGAPDQAIQNHPPGREEVMDYELGSGGVMPIWGALRVDLKNRQMFVDNSNWHAESFGDHFVSTNPQYIVPDGLAMLKYGFPTLNGGGGLQTDGLDESAWGDIVVTAVEPFIRYLLPQGIAPPALTTQDVQNFIRPMPVAGMLTMAMGGPIVQRPPPPAKPAGLDATIFGPATFVDFRIRDVDPEGDDMLQLIYDIGYFDERLTVTETAYRHVVGIGAGDQSAVGTPFVADKTRTLNVLGGIESQIFAVPKTRKQNIMEVVSLGDQFAGFGDPWVLPRVQNHIEPRGDEWDVLGIPSLLNTIAPVGWLDTVIVPTTGIAHLLGVEGWDASQLPAPAVIGVGCGTRVRAMVGWDSSVVGMPLVTHYVPGR